MSARRAPPRRDSATARRKQQRLPEKPDATPSEDKIDESLKETFPASDPPSWTLVARIGSPRREHGTASDAGTDQDDVNEPSDDERRALETLRYELDKARLRFESKAPKI